MTDDTPIHCFQSGVVTGEAHAMPTDPRVALHDASGVVPCSRLVCRLCNAPVLHVDGLAFEFRRDEHPFAAGVSCDPLDWLAAGEFAQWARAYACRCRHATILGVVPVGHLDAHDIHAWECSGHPASERSVEDRPSVQSLRDAVAARVPMHFQKGGWLASTGADEGLGNGRLRTHAWTDDTCLECDATTLAARYASLSGAAVRSVARQLAIPRWTHRPLYAAFVQGWKHGDLDSQLLEGLAADVPTLLARLRALSAQRPNSQSIVYVAVPGLMHRSGYRALDEYT